MAPRILQKPSTQYGPCGDPQCEHHDCREVRKMASCVCGYCNEPIGYESPFYDISDQGEWILVHAACLEDDLGRR